MYRDDPYKLDWDRATRKWMMELNNGDEVYVLLHTGYVVPATIKKATGSFIYTENYESVFSTTFGKEVNKPCNSYLIPKSPKNIETFRRFKALMWLRDVDPAVLSTDDILAMRRALEAIRPDL